MKKILVAIALIVFILSCSSVFSQEMPVKKSQDFQRSLQFYNKIEGFNPQKIPLYIMCT